MELLNVAEFVSCTESEGPGKRSAIWLQGCLRRCPGCCNSQMWDLEARHIVAWPEVLGSILEARARLNIEGVTFLGGEPFLQTRGLSRLAQGCHASGLSVIVFTGYTLGGLSEENLARSDELLRYTDLLVDGPYIRELPEDRRNWVGSSNQRFHYLSNVYSPEIETDSRYAASAEIRVRPDGRLVVNGMPGMVRIGEKENGS